MTLTVGGGNSSDFNKREECTGEIFSVRPVVVPSTRPVTGPAGEYLDCAPPPTPMFSDWWKRKHLLMSTEISHNNAGRSDLSQTLSGSWAHSSLISFSSALRALDNFWAPRTIPAFVSPVRKDLEGCGTGVGGVHPTCRSAKENNRAESFLGEDSEIKVPICKHGGEACYRSAITKQTDRRQVGKEDKSVSLWDVMSWQEKQSASETEAIRLSAFLALTQTHTNTDTACK